MLLKVSFENFKNTRICFCPSTYSNIHTYQTHAKHFLSNFLLQHVLDHLLVHWNTISNQIKSDPADTIQIQKCQFSHQHAPPANIQFMATLSLPLITSNVNLMTFIFLKDLILRIISIVKKMICDDNNEMFIPYPHAHP